MTGLAAGPPSGVDLTLLEGLCPWVSVARQIPSAHQPALNVEAALPVAMPAGGSGLDHRSHLEDPP